MLLEEGENIEYEIGANLKKSLEFVGGLLTITNKRFVFKPHHVNIQKADVSFELNDINKLETSNALGNIPNSIKVDMKRGTPHTFVVGFSHLGKRKKIVNRVEELIK